MNEDFNPEALTVFSGVIPIEYDPNTQTTVIELASLPVYDESAVDRFRARDIIVTAVPLVYPWVALEEDRRMERQMAHLIDHDDEIRSGIESRYSRGNGMLYVMDVVAPLDIGAPAALHEDVSSWSHWVQAALSACHLEYIQRTSTPEQYGRWMTLRTQSIELERRTIQHLEDAFEFMKIVGDD